MAGKLIVIEGMDGCGKNTQTKLLVDRIIENGFKAATMSFPRYESKWGKKIKDYLDGKYGSLKTLNPLIASFPYALDREEASEYIRELLSNDVNVALDRFAESNLGHQGAKLKGEARKNLIEILRHFEHEILEIPKADMVIYLDLPIEETAKAIRRRNEEKAKRDETIAKDIHEEDLEYQTNVRETYLEIAHSSHNWRIINCIYQNNVRLNEKEVSDLVWANASTILGKP